MPQKGGAFLPSDPDMRRGAGTQGQPCRAFGGGLGDVDMQICVHVGLHQRGKVRQGRDRHHPRHRKIQIGAPHTGRKMPACRMTGDHHGARDSGGGGAHRLGHFLGHGGDAAFGGQSVGGHCTGPAPRQRTGGQMAVIGAVAGQPIPSMHKDQKTLGAGFRVEKVKGLPRAGAIGDVQRGPLGHPGAKRGRLGLPARIIGIAVWNEGRVLIITAQIGHGMIPVTSRICGQ